MNNLLGRSFILAIFLFLIESSYGVQVPFVLPWDDSEISSTDLSSWNKPIGSNDRLRVDADGHFSVNGKRIRLLGINFTTDTPFQPTNKMDAVAARLAKFGFNCVRFHHIDPPWALNQGVILYNSGSSTNLNPQQLAKIHYMVSKLKAHGIYSDINLLVSRQFKKADGLPAEIETMDWKDQHIVGMFNDNALALHKDYASKLLCATNPWTGIPLASDPAVAIVEIMNENGIIQKWLEGAIDNLPQVFALQLQQKWNNWLSEKYVSNQAMLDTWKIVNEALGKNLIKNGAFTNSLNSWSTEAHNGAKASFSVDKEFNGQPAAKIQIITPGTESWHVQLNQPGLKMNSNQIYTVSFWAKASEPIQMNFSIMQAHPEWQALWLSQNIQLTTNWFYFQTTFESTVYDTNARPNFGGFATRQVTVWVADVKVQTGGQLGTLPEGISLDNKNIPIVKKNSDQILFTKNAKRDWIEFLWTLDRRYWEEMYKHVREVCGFPGIIIGTIIANSPPNAQSIFDAADGHAYWQHPQFPDKPWDPDNWIVQNISMLNTTGNGNTIASLARQRIKGKPFTVTEYQHPYPNYYSAEGVLIATAYGSLQDWDGIWFFDYGTGTDSTATGFINGFFATFQHPTRMANMIAAAALFRRGDVSLATNEYIMQLPPELEIDTIMNKGYAWSIADASHLGLPPELCLVSRTALSIGTNTVGLKSPPDKPAGPVYTSDNGELSWNTSNPGKNILTINTRNTKAVIGFSDNKTFNLDGIVFRPYTTDLGWSTIVLTMLDGDSLTNSGRAIIVASGKVDNTDMVWKNSNKNSVGRNWGKAPTLVEVVPFSLSLPVSADRILVFALDEKGKRKSSVPVTSSNEWSIIEFKTNYNTIWYEIIIAPNTPFDKWRFTNFTPEELEDEQLSGLYATPAGDRVPNFVKYAFGFPPKQYCQDTLNISGMHCFVGQDQTPTIVYQRSKIAKDIQFLHKISTNLIDWNVLDPTQMTVNVIDDFKEQVQIKLDGSLLNQQSLFFKLMVQKP